MGYKFIALVSDGNQEIPLVNAGALEALGMKCCLTQDRLHVFVASGTPTILVPGRGLLIGHLFTLSGQPVTGELIFDRTDKSLQTHLLDSFWGEYVVVEPQQADGSGARFLRDPSGGLPCFYGLHSGGRFVTSSVSIACDLGLCSREVDWDFVMHALVYPYLRSERTALRGIRELLQGCSLDIRGGQASTTIIWSPWTFVAPNRRLTSTREATSIVRSAVSLAVKAWAEIDRSILLELSGGLDSSIVAACLREADARTICCTMVAPVPGTDERQYARQVADHHQFELLSADIDLENARFEFPPPQDSTVPGMGILHHPVDSAVAALAGTLDVASLFSGAGGDSIFCYLRGATPAADAFKERGMSAGITAIRDLSTLHQCSLTQAGRLALRKLIRGPKPHWKPVHEGVDPTRRSIPFDAHPWFDTPENALPGDQERISDLAGTQSFRDGVARSARWPMRYPLLSQPVMEACLRVPTWMWIAGGRNRSIARSAFSDALPSGVLNRRSKGTYTRYYAAIHDRHRDAMLSFLMDGMLASRGLLDLDELRREAASAHHPERSLNTRLFDLCMVENWVRHQGGPSAPRRLPASAV
ncbi:asparagine synthase family protein [Pseudoxanthomonas wuyuanensis]|uniref:asparagine synthase (glutamine-hydrolyzing) n=1 Tax=Pseudoxanthomonas wuyuanensis TaxID=1073196 RepID=A0A286DBL4_9GAMM|nr:asparagine synthetase B family protein [Pseudoxanthomonas wuyuanensis]KAF1721718.1 asparagine synthetase B family protein [Pseudoxanthomonas wuyuanensis]SOD56046.1 asparagine synthase (glutamine-hydrolysing) [Pseudoxanthomonas wuyuanensis]